MFRRREGHFEPPTPYYNNCMRKASTNLIGADIHLSNNQPAKTPKMDVLIDAIFSSEIG